MVAATIPATSLIHANGDALRKPDEIKTGLEKIKLIANISKSALEHFLSGNLAAFDALVGENACETRAGNLLDLYENGKLRTNLSATLSKLDEICKKFEDPSFIENAKKDPSNLRTSLSNICTKLNVHFDLMDEEAFLALSFLLTVTKEEHDGQDSADPLKLKKYADLSPTICKTLHKAAQKDLSQRSVAYIQKLAQESKNKQIIEFTQAEYIAEDDRGRVAAPCFFALSAILKHIWERKQAILYKIHLLPKNSPPLFLLFKPGKEPGSFELADIGENLMTAAHVWEGSSDLPRDQVKKAFEKLTPFMIFAMNNAQHPFYFGNSKTRQINWGTAPLHKKARKQNIFLKALAKLIGCHKDNRAVFYHDHSFCDLVKNQTQKPSSFSEKSARKFEIVYV